MVDGVKVLGINLMLCLDGSVTLSLVAPFAPSLCDAQLTCFPKKRVVGPSRRHQSFRRTLGNRASFYFVCSRARGMMKAGQFWRSDGCCWVCSLSRKRCGLSHLGGGAKALWKRSFLACRECPIAITVPTTGVWSETGLKGRSRSMWGAKQIAGKKK